MKQICVFFLFCASLCAQSIIAPASTVNGVPATSLITICTTNPGSGTCASLVPTYTTIGLTVSCTGTGGPLSGTGCTNPGTSDSAGNIIAFAAAGQYWCQYKPSTNAIAYSLPCSATGGNSANLASPGPIGGTTPGTVDTTGLTVHGSTGTETYSETNGSTLIYTSASCEAAGAPTTLSTSSTTTTTGQLCLPAGSIIDYVSARVTTTITGTCTGWELGDGTTAARFTANNTTLTAGTTSDAAHIGTYNNTGINSATTGIWQATAHGIVITCATGNPSAGAIRIQVYYHQGTPATQ